MSDPTFSQLFDGHLKKGTGLGKVRPRKWTAQTIAIQLGVSQGSITNWRTSKTSPDRNNFQVLLHTFFGDQLSDEREELVRAYNSELQFRDPLGAGADDFTIAADVIQQIPAAYRFTVENSRIAPEAPQGEPVSPDTARDLYTELVEKVHLLLERARERSQDQHVITSSARLLSSLSSGFNNVRPGVVQSRLRTIESIRSAYDTDDGRDQTFPDFRAMIDDVWLSGQDYLVQFPEIREIERQRVALEVERSPASINVLATQISRIKTLATESDILTEDALNALTDVLPQIASAISVEEKINLLGDSILTARNFLSAAIRGVTTTGKSGAVWLWGTVKDDLTNGIQSAARVLPTFAVVALFIHLAGPVGEIAALLNSDMFRSLSKVVSQITKLDKSASAKK